MGGLDESSLESAVQQLGVEIADFTMEEEEEEEEEGLGEE